MYDCRIKELLSLETSKSERIHELEQILSQQTKELSITKMEQEIDKQSFALTRKEIENKCAVVRIFFLHIISSTF